MNMHAITNGKLFGAYRHRVHENPIIPNTQPQIILNSPQRSRPQPND
jgi:hypothetical protein